MFQSCSLLTGNCCVSSWSRTFLFIGTDSDTDALAALATSSTFTITITFNDEMWCDVMFGMFHNLQKHFDVIIMKTHCVLQEGRTGKMWKMQESVLLQCKMSGRKIKQILPGVSCEDNTECFNRCAELCIRLFNQLLLTNHLLFIWIGFHLILFCVSCRKRIGQCTSWSVQQLLHLERNGVHQRWRALWPGSLPRRSESQ